MTLEPPELPQEARKKPLLGQGSHQEGQSLCSHHELRAPSRRQL